MQIGGRAACPFVTEQRRRRKRVHVCKLPEIQVSSLNFTECSCLPHITSTSQILHKRKKAHSKQTAFRSKQIMEQTMEQNGTICKQNQTKYKHQQEQQEQDDDFQKSNFCVKENREYLKINYYLKKHENFHIKLLFNNEIRGFWGGGFCHLVWQTKPRASSCIQEFLRGKISHKSYYILWKKKRVEIVIFRSYAVACRQHVCQGFKKTSYFFFGFLTFSQIWRSLLRGWSTGLTPRTEQNWRKTNPSLTEMLF